MMFARVARKFALYVLLYIIYACLFMFIASEK